MATLNRLEVVHDTVYDYAALVSPAFHLGHLQPLADADQQLLSFDLRVSPQPDELRTETDVYGNVRCLFAVVAAHRRLHVRATSRLALAARFVGLSPELSPPWELLAQRLCYVARAPFEPAVEFVQPSPYVPRLEVLRAYALQSFTNGRPVAAAALDLMHRVYADFRYDGDSTQIDTPLLQAFKQKAGVCQDFAHVMAGALRMLGLPARYVSGYLQTQPAPGSSALVGADASHAWVQVWAPGTPGVAADGWLDLDPTNDVVPGAGHVRVAVGRDYADVTPLRGVIRGSSTHTLSVAVRTRVLDPQAGPGVAWQGQEQVQ